ncbi:MAG: outer membrane beta-barrel protein, partial [Candidatus Eremiobacteraeota bacterium]|nr:outer membrane beta-barrel protein [Candidatus Eremiobacteraeota bacterium]
NATGALDTASGKDAGSRPDFSNILASVTRNTGRFRFGATVGEYAFPVVGLSINPTFKTGANTDLFGFVPVAYVAYAPSEELTISVGKQATLLGQESNFTFQNVDIQRGLAFAVEPNFSRGLRAAYANGKLSGDLEVNDGYYSGSHRAVEGLAGFAPTGNTSVQFAFIVPGKDTPADPTTGIANKAEYDLMLTQQLGKLQLTPYLLFIDSPQSNAAGFVNGETAFAGAVLGSYAFSRTLSLGARYEDIGNHSAPHDPSLNADFVGYGAGSGASTLTLTPAYKRNQLLLRAEYSVVGVRNPAPGAAFGATGTATSQTRLGIEIGAQF